MLQGTVGRHSCEKDKIWGCFGWHLALKLLPRNRVCCSGNAYAGLQARSAASSHILLFLGARIDWWLQETVHNALLCAGLAWCEVAGPMSWVLHCLDQQTLRRCALIALF